MTIVAKMENPREPKPTHSNGHVGAKPRAREKKIASMRRRAMERYRNAPFLFRTQIDTRVGTVEGHTCKL
jgi:hypothetical protein